ncbi:unnamed protein product, partial [Oppiella nova]
VVLWREIVYDSDTTLIPKNTSVEVARVPVTGNHKKSWDRLDNHNTKGSSNISTSYSTEDEKIKAMMSQSTQELMLSEALTDVKRSTGIPRSFMIPANADQKGALLTASGDYAVPIIDHQAYKEVKKEKPPFMPIVESEASESTQEIPEDLKCTLCQDVLLDAVLTPCCVSETLCWRATVTSARPVMK